jgi:exonuclease III
VLGEDFNTVSSPSIDCFPPKSGRASKDWTILAEKVQQWNMCDLHTKHSGNIPQLTHWQNTQVGAVGNRIDYIFVNNQMAQLFSETQLQVCGFSDHFGVSTKMKLRLDIPRGKGLWKMNCSCYIPTCNQYILCLVIVFYI